MLLDLEEQQRPKWEEDRAEEEEDEGEEDSQGVRSDLKGEGHARWGQQRRLRGLMLQHLQQSGGRGGCMHTSPLRLGRSDRIHSIHARHHTIDAAAAAVLRRVSIAELASSPPMSMHTPTKQQGDDGGGDEDDDDDDVSVKSCK
jgi:hypothetical protein